MLRLCNTRGRRRFLPPHRPGADFAQPILAPGRRRSLRWIKNGRGRAIIRQAIIYGLFLAAGTLALQGLDYLWFARTHSGEIYVFLIALLFLGIGVAVGASALRRPSRTPFDGNPQALASLGISARELTVLKELAAGHSNKEIAARLHVSPHTVKTHVARLLEKLEAKRRTDAIHRARELGILP